VAEDQLGFVQLQAFYFQIDVGTGTCFLVHKRSE